MKIAAIIAMIGLVGCGSSAPKCSDEVVLDVAREIFDEQLERTTLLGYAHVLQGVSVNVDFNFIVHRGYDATTNIRNCSATLIVTTTQTETQEKTGEGEMPITYEVALTEDGENFVVEISGLHDLFRRLFGI